MPPVIRVSDITRKSQKRKELDQKVIQTYWNELKNAILKNPSEFLEKFTQPIKYNAEEYLKNLRFYGLQKTEEGSEYVMMQDWSKWFLCLNYHNIAINSQVLPIKIYLDLEKAREENLEAEGDESREYPWIYNYLANQNNSYDKSIATESIHIHNKALFDAFNEALMGFRPHQSKGEPLPWDSNHGLKINYSKGLIKSYNILNYTDVNRNTEINSYHCNSFSSYSLVPCRPKMWQRSRNRKSYRESL